MARRTIIDYLFRGKRTRAVDRQGNTLLDDNEAAAARKHLAAHGLKVVGSRVIEVDDPWHAWVKAARPDVDLTHVNHALLERLAAACRELGHSCQVISGFRSRELQERLYAGFLKHGGALVAPPGRSNHERGEACDVYVDGVPIGAFPNKAVGHAVLRSHGLVLGASGELWHVERAEVGEWRA